MPQRFYSTCSRCRANPATNGSLCVTCCARKHIWRGTAHHSTCRVCGLERFKKRKRTAPGQQGSRWQTWYGVDPESGEKPNPLPSCR